MNSTNESSVTGTSLRMIWNRKNSMSASWNCVYSAAYMIPPFLSLYKMATMLMQITPQFSRTHERCDLVSLSSPLRSTCFNSRMRAKCDLQLHRCGLREFALIHACARGAIFMDSTMMAFAVLL